MSLRECFTRHQRVFAFLAFLVFAVYFNSLGNDFVSDDIGTIRDNPLIDKVNYLTYFGFNLRSLINFLTYKFFVLNPFFFRLSNILFHLGSSWLVFLLMTFFFKSPIPLITAGIFAVHPILSESVTWISGGPYSNGSFFILLSFLTYLLAKSNQKRKFYLLSIGSFIAALFFSEKFFIFSFVFLLYEFSLGNLRKSWSELIPFLMISGFWLLRLLGLLGVRTATLETASLQQPGVNNPFIQIPVAITSYLELIFWPKDLTLYHSEMNFRQFEYLSRLGLFLFFLGIIIWSLKYYRQIFFWASFFLVALSPTLTPLRISWIVAERYVYPAALGIFVIIAILIQKAGEISRNQKISYIVFGIIILALSTRTIIRNLDWQNQDTLWLAAAKTSPSSPQNHNNLGDLYGRRGDLNKAVEEFKKAIELLPGYADAYHNLANTYTQMGKFDLAIENYQNALKFNPNLWQSYQNLAAIYFGQEQYDLALENLKQALKISPQNPNLHINLGIIYLKKGNQVSAKEAFLKALKIDPQNPRAKQLLLQSN